LYRVPCLRNDPGLALADWDSVCVHSGVQPSWRLPHLVARKTNPTDMPGLRLGLRPLGIVWLEVRCSLHHHGEDIHPGRGCLITGVSALVLLAVGDVPAKILHTFCVGKFAEYRAA
jgi:hypothetical protein